MGCYHCNQKSKELAEAYKEKSGYAKAIGMAEIESLADDKICVVVEQDEKFVGLCRECWEKDGATGTVVVTIYPPHYKDVEP